MTGQHTPDTDPKGGHTAGALDIHNIIGGLWSGLGLLVVGVAFVAWARLRPIEVR